MVANQSGHNNMNVLRRNTVKLKKIILAVMSITALGATPVYAGEAHAHWGYQGHTGPANVL